MTKQNSATPAVPTAPADFETAISASGFGVFNILLLLVSIPATLASMFEVATVSYILPSAECDLQLSLMDKGILNAITYAGMISSAIPWGYLADTKGRKKSLVLGLALDIFFVLGSAVSQNVYQLMIFKFLGGLVMCGPFAVLMSYLTELHGKDYRNRIMMLVGLMFSTSTLLLPIMAVFILPNQWNFQIFGLTFYSWQIFLAASAIPSFVSASLLSLFPESPKFLMSQGRNAEALEVLRKIYALNKHKPKNTYPITELVKEVPEKVSTTTTQKNNIFTVEAATKSIQTAKTEKKITSSSFRAGLLQLRPLFSKPYLGLSLQVYLMNFCLLLSQNTMRLWLPQLFASISEYEKISSEVTSMCTILEYNVNKTALLTHEIPGQSCQVVITAASYTNNIIVGFSGLFGFLVAGALVNLLGTKRLITISSLISGVCGISLYWSASSMSTLIITSLLVTMGSISATSTISVSTSLFPTLLRTMVLSLAMMFGRIGSLFGNILFPTFMSLGCIPPFLMISSVMTLATILSAFLPNPNKTTFK